MDEEVTHFTWNTTSAPYNVTSATSIPANHFATWIIRAYIVYLGLVLVVGVLGNAMAALVHAVLPRKTHGDWMLIALCVCDGCIVLCHASTSLSEYTGRWRLDGSLGLCRFTRWLGGGFITASFLLLTFGAFLTKYTITSIQWRPVSPIVVKVAILICFAGGLLIYLGVMFFVYQDVRGTCRFMDDRTTGQVIFFAVYFFVIFSAIFTMAVIYSLILRYIRRHNRSVVPHLGNAQSRSPTMKVERVSSQNQSRSVNYASSQIQPTTATPNQDQLVIHTSDRNQLATQSLSGHRPAVSLSDQNKHVLDVTSLNKPAMLVVDESNLVEAAENRVGTDNQHAADTSITGLEKMSGSRAKYSKSSLARSKLTSNEIMSRMVQEWDRSRPRPSTSFGSTENPQDCNKDIFRLNSGSLRPVKSDGQLNFTLESGDGLRTVMEKGEPNKTVVAKVFEKLDSNHTYKSHTPKNDTDPARTESRGENSAKVQKILKGTNGGVPAAESKLPTEDPMSERSSGLDRNTTSSESNSSRGAGPHLSQPRRSNRSQLERRLALLFFTQTIIVFLAWLPTFILYLSWLYNGNLQAETTSQNFMNLFFRSIHQIGHITNPLVYAIFNHKFRENSRRLPENLSKTWLGRKVRNLVCSEARTRNREVDGP